MADILYTHYALTHHMQQRHAARQKELLIRRLEETGHHVQVVGDEVIAIPKEKLMANDELTQTHTVDAMRIYHGEKMHETSEFNTLEEAREFAYVMMVHYGYTIWLDGRKLDSHIELNDTRAAKGGDYAD